MMDMDISDLTILMEEEPPFHGGSWWVRSVWSTVD